jgi:hypothetical protein
MKHILLTTLLALGALAGGAASVQAEHYAKYYPHGWYVPKGPCWLRWHGYREVWMPPSSTNWTVERPLGEGQDDCRPASPQLLFQPIPYNPPAPHNDGGWAYGKTGGCRPVTRELIPHR